MNNIRSTWRRTPIVLLLLSLIIPILVACGSTPQPAAPAAPAATTAPAAPAATAAPAAPAATAAPAAPEATAAPEAPATGSEEGTPGGTMTGAWIGPCCVGVDNNNPMIAGGDYHWLNKIYSHLVTYNVEYTEMVGDLAESWETSSDNLTWTFKLRDGVQWHDGSALTAEDVAFSIELCVNPAAGGCTKAGQLMAIVGAKEFVDGTATSISGLDYSNPSEIKITTLEPNAPMLDTLTETWILHKATLGQVPSDQIKGNEYWGKVAIGTGPFKLLNYEPGQYMELGRFDNYFRGAPLLEKLIRRHFQDPATALLAFDRGEIDFTYVTADEVEREMANDKATVLPGPSQVDIAITMNPGKNPAFGNTLFRQAFLHAINRESIIENLYQGAAKPVNCLFGNELYIPADEYKYNYDPEKSKALLAEAGIDPASLGTITMDTYYNDQLTMDVMTAIQQDLAAVGINIAIQQMDGPSWTKRMYDDLDSEMSFIGGANGADPHRAYMYYHSSVERSNVYKFNDPTLDQLLEDGATEMDAAKRVEIYQQACKVMSEKLPWLFLWETVRYGIVSERIGNFIFTPAAGGGSYYDAAEKWYIRN